MATFTNAVNIFVLDRNGVSIPGAVVQVLDNGAVIGEATTKPNTDAPVTLYLPAAFETVMLRATVEGQRPQEAVIDVRDRNHTFHFPDIVINPPHEGGTPSMTAAWVFGSILLVFFIALVFWNPANLGQTQQQVVKYLVATFVGLFAGFFSGSLKLGGKLPFLNDITIAAAGAFAAFVLVLLLWGR